MIPHDDFAPYGYLDNPFHCWKINPSGVLRSLQPLGMGWHVPNLGSYVRNQFQYTAHLQIGLKIGKTVLITPEDFKRHECSIVSHLHTKNRFEYTCTVPKHNLTLAARYFLVQEHALGCILTLSTTAKQSLPVTCYLMHQHQHNPQTSRLWEHGLYAINGPQKGVCMLGIASEGDVFVHGACSADGGPLAFGQMGYVITLEDAATWVHEIPVSRPNITEHEESTGWQMRTVILPFNITLEDSDAGRSEHIINAVLARGVSQDQSYQHWIDGVEEIARAESDHRADDERFWQFAPQLSGDWPVHWQRGLVYDLETLRMVIRHPVGVINHFFDGMQIQAPRLVLAEAAMDVLFLSYANPELAAEVILGHFESAPHSQLPCMREDGSYNMVADDGQICGTAPEWGYPVWCCNQIWLKTGNLHWLRRLYPHVAAYLRWWLDNRRDAEGWLVWSCIWESGQDFDACRPFGPQPTGGSTIEHIRPVDLQASMAQGAEILMNWATLLAREGLTLPEIDFPAEAEWWRNIAEEFSAKTRMMWQDGWFRDYNSLSQAWSSQQDAMHLAPIFCGPADWEQREQLRQYLSQPPGEALCWPPVVMTLIGAASAAQMPLDAAELAYRFIDASYRSTDSHELDEHGGLPGVTREYRRTITMGKRSEMDYANAGIEGYGWGALSVHLLMRYLVGLCEEEADKITIAPALPQALRRVGAVYRVGPVPWGSYVLAIEYRVLDAEGYTVRLRCAEREREEGAEAEELQRSVLVQECEWEGTWGEKRTLQLPHLSIYREYHA